MLHVIFAEGLADRAVIERQLRGADALAAARAALRPRAHRGGHRRARRDGARARARLRGGAQRGRVRAHRIVPRAASARWSPTCSTRSTPSRATSTGPAARCSAARRSRSTRSAEKAGLATYGKERSRIGDFPDVIGNLPADADPAGDHDPRRPADPRILRLGRQPGAVGAERRGAGAGVRAARPAGLARLLRERHEPSRRLRAARRPRSSSARTCRSRSSGFFSTPFMQVTEAVVPPRGEARQEWRIIDDLSRRIGIAPYSLKPLRTLARLGYRISPRRLIDAGAAHRPGRRLVRADAAPACR